jgi:hypothetical protein
MVTEWNTRALAIKPAAIAGFENLAASYAIF